MADDKPKLSEEEKELYVQAYLYMAFNKFGKYYFKHTNAWTFAGKIKKEMYAFMPIKKTPEKSFNTVEEYVKYWDLLEERVRQYFKTPPKKSDVNGDDYLEIMSRYVALKNIFEAYKKFLTKNSVKPSKEDGLTVKIKKYKEEN